MELENRLTINHCSLSALTFNFTASKKGASFPPQKLYSIDGLSRDPQGEPRLVTTLVPLRTLVMSKKTMTQASNLKDGLYLVENIPDTDAVYVLRENGQLTLIDYDEVVDLLAENETSETDEKIDTSADITHTTRLQSKIKQVQTEQKEIAYEGTIIYPVFHTLPTLNDLLYTVKTYRFNEDDYFKSQTTAYKYRSYKPYVVADTLDDVKKQIDSIYQQREIEALEAHQQSQQLPELEGTAKQIKWAMQIRYKIYKADPNDKRLARHTKARYWIDNRKKF